ncbi:AsmA family protein [Rhodobacter sp. Har01]|uniref:AsmA family protein n=1 Tax=Rhodobacter sp. Har01 TaxID=2883999 RepID=UPI001D08E2D8|nr:AsmA family protein [Rhodobacter sp. Har01]MCB6177169.1 AsmA family protein [Rhodobacter sp. Har01]
MLWVALVSGLLVCAVGLAALVLTGRPIRLPVWAVAEVEDRINARIGGSHLPQGAALSLGSIEVSVERDLVPRIVVRDIRLVEPSGQSLVALPEVRTTLDAGALLTGHLRPGSLRLSGARIAVTRDEEGRIALSLGQLSGSPGPRGAADLLDALDRMFSSEALAGLRLIEADALTLTLTDRRAGRVWEVGDGRLVVENKPGALAAELSLTLLDGATSAQARLAVQTDKADSSARLWAMVDRVASADLAVQAAPLAFLEVVTAPISGRLVGNLDEHGRLSGMEAQLTLGEGSLRVDAAAQPVGFDAAGLALRYLPGRNRVWLDAMTVESDSLRVKAAGSIDLLDAAGVPAAAGMLPEALVVQLDFSEAMVDPEGLFAAPVRFSDGVLDLALWLRPFRAEIGQLTLVEGEERLTLRGQIAAGEAGVETALDVSLNAISTERLVKLWPVAAVAQTRDWLAENVGQGELQDVDAALRLAPGAAPRFALDYEFSGAEVRFIRTLPPVQDGRGRAVIEGNSYTVVLEGGHVTAPMGGRIDVAGSVFRVPDITRRPADAEVRLLTDADLTATLSLLDQEPFRFITKAGRPVDLGSGRAVLVSDLRFPLKARVLPEDVTYDVSGRVVDFRSDQLVPGQWVTSPDMAVKVTRQGMTLSGEGMLAEMPIVARYEQEFAPEAAGRSSVRGTAELSDANLRALGVTLPEGWFAGSTTATVDLALTRGAPAELVLTSDLTGATLKVGALSWSKKASTAGELTVEATLSSPPQVGRIALKAAGLTAEGRLSTRQGGGLDKAVFPRLTVGKWLDASVEITGRGAGKAVGVALTGGTLDLRNRPSGGDGGGSGAIAVALDRLVISTGIALTGFQGNFKISRGGLDGSFGASVNGKGRIEGTTVPTSGGTAVRIRSDDAGAVMAAAGVFAKGRGGTLDLTLQPRGAEGTYVGIAAFKALSVQGAPALAELLSAVSVVGLLEQMNGQGIQFNEGDAEFLLRPEGVEIRRGAAMGASLGLSFAGLYRFGSGQMDIQGTISPIYLLNGIGQIFTRKGEGVFGFNYRMTGTSDNPQVSVNPLSILTPAMFREIFRRPVPTLEGGGG